MSHLSQNRRAIEAFRDLYAPEQVEEVVPTIVCPSCGETIKADSLYCPLCQHDLSRPAPKAADVSHGVVLVVFAALLLLDLALPVLFLFTLNPFPGHLVVAGITLLLMILYKIMLGRRAAQSRSSGKPSSGLMAGLVLLAMVPVASWFVAALAARRVALAPAARVLFPFLAAVLVAADFALAVGLIPVAGDGTTMISNVLDWPYEGWSLMQPLPTGIWPTAQAVATERAGCRDALSVTSADVGQTLCVRGRVRVGYGRRGNYYIKFSSERDDFFILGYDWDYSYGGVNPGDCVMLEGKIEQLSGGPVMIIEEKQLALCPQ